MEKTSYSYDIAKKALDMGAITAHFTTEEAAIKAFMAGNDLLLMPSSFEKAYKAILDAVRGGIIPMERLDESVLRILRYKLTHFLVWE
jgi:beta-N-acetylhexosaminidase